WGEWVSCKSDLNLAYRYEERFWKQKARIQWLREGDHNSKFFHAQVKQRRVTNSLDSILKPDGSLCLNVQDTLFELLFHQIFKSSNPLDQFCNLQNFFMPMLSKEGLLIEKETETALFDMSQDKSPGADGFTALFFQNAWPVIKYHVCLAVYNFFSCGKMPKGLNHTVITLIPQKKNPTKVADYRPISLCSVVYKIFAKVIANRLKPVLSSCISVAQSTFVLGRQILDNVIISNECIHYLNSERKGKNFYMALKLDMAKAYDRVEWSFIARICRQMGFCDVFVSWILACVCSTSYSFNVNGA
ncbi:DNAse I-like superfamily protein, partial [Striga hermonthica]